LAENGCSRSKQPCQKASCFANLGVNKENVPLALIETKLSDDKLAGGKEDQQPPFSIIMDICAFLEEIGHVCRQISGIFDDAKVLS
jgi:hypothetical protein